MKLYLIRKNLQTYIGPLTLDEFVYRYNRMQITQQDEIAESLKKWVCLENFKELAEYYPEIFKIITRGLPYPQNHNNQILLQHKEKKVINKHKSNYTTNWIPYMLLILNIVIIGIAIVYFDAINLIKKQLNFQKQNNLPAINIATEYINTNNIAALETYLDNYKNTLFPQINNSRQIYNEWIPIIRYLAFSKNGTVDGINPRLLKGLGTKDAPTYCTVTNWKERILTHTQMLENIFSYQEIPTEDWTVVFLWDPYWIRRRNNIKGWIKPINYYTACIHMAHKAVSQILSTNSNINRTNANTKDIKIKEENFITKEKTNIANDKQNILKLLLLRLDYLLKIINNEEIIKFPKINYENNLLFILNCLENPNTTSIDDIDKCISKKTYQSISIEEIKKFIYQRKIQNKIRLLLKSKDTLNDKNLQLLSKLSKDLITPEPITKMDYNPEHKYILSLILYNGSIKEAQKRAKYEFSEMDFNL